MKVEIAKFAQASKNVSIKIRMALWASDNYKQKIIDDGEGMREALRLRKMNV